MTDRPPPETVHVPDGPLEVKAPPPVTASDARLPKFGRFQTTAPLGAGAMGTVYRAHDDMLGRDVAIKSLTADDGLGTRERFLREARAIGALQHANILGIFDAGTEGATPYLVMELASEGTLRDRIKSGPPGQPVSVETVRDVGAHIGRALAAAHAANILHRDVKPANILATRDAAGTEVWKLADFGIARLPDSTLTVTGQFIGSPSYAAPESLRAGQFSAASDVYALAATLYESLCGSPPHGDHDMSSVIRKLDHEAPPLHTRRPGVPAPIEAAIMAGLARDPAQRPSASDLARMLVGESSSTAQSSFGTFGTSASAPNLATHGVAPTAAAAAANIAAAAPNIWSRGGANAPSVGAHGVANAPSIAAYGSGASAPGLVSSTSHDAVNTMSTGPRGATSSRTKLIAIGLAALALIAIIFATTRHGDDATPSATGLPMTTPTPVDNPSEPRDDETQPTPTFVDQNGNPVDEETAKQILQQMQQDAEDQLDRRGPGRHKHKHGD